MLQAKALLILNVLGDVSCLAPRALEPKNRMPNRLNRKIAAMRKIGMIQKWY